MVSVTIDSVRVMHAGSFWWARKYQWQPSSIACSAKGADGRIPWTWSIKGLGISGSGSFGCDPSSIQWSWDWTAEQDWPAEGTALDKEPHGGLQYELDLASPVRRGYKWPIRC